MQADVVEKKQGAGAGGEHVVDRQIDQVATEDLVAAKLQAEQDFAAHAVGAGDEDWIAHILLEMKESGESAKAAEDGGPMGRAHMPSDAADILLCCSDVHARGRVSSRHGRSLRSAQR